MHPDPRHHLLLCTCPDVAQATRLAEQLVEEELAACVNLVPGLTSIYRWAGEIAREREVLLLIKTSAERSRALIDRLAELHPYETPEAIAVPITEGLADYLNWIDTATGAHR
ncbi:MULTISPECIES: divalent-cation tolerance protein CutA [Marichromatium]|uniref:Periplasmic divalent cation tolerance protein n=1 Tax=Marichromatium gracile TaxID=1048 RepID=A0A4R4ALE6_MARGR|nr:MULTISPECIES: divalent-cation tolerance protein CutA [Marichromatium]MBO8087574.1 divalent-cation tolerance protein CutA [Marichromatium sp.]MBK1709892.1 divalent-cation tolerance protein CutA [Marichromatium gracile]RNE92226.1 divalent-cation tolerance protein CutA [Marichromatium sp. AB31]RNE92673.1 divalent-cation tolerance protein CutA [Marichromatium sp. AB32]TCW39646.1 periplasmic divalent cation tolerance protein [Marichromatium gracile]